MLEDKEKLKLEFDFLKGLFFILILAFFSNIAYIFTKDLTGGLYVLNSLSVIALGFITFRTYKQIYSIIKRN